MRGSSHLGRRCQDRLYKERDKWRHSTDTAPVTGSLVFFATFELLYEYCAAECAVIQLFCGMVCDCLDCHDLFIRRVDLCSPRTMDGAALVEDCSGIMIGVELCVPWDAPEAIVDINSEGVVPLNSIPDVVGLFGRRDARSIRLLVPDSQGLDQDMGGDAGVKCVFHRVVATP